MLLLLVVLGILLASTAAADTPAKLEDLVSRAAAAGGARSAIGVTRQGTPIPSLLGDGALDHESGKTRVLIVGGLDGSEGTVEAAVQAWEWFHGADSGHLRAHFTLSVVPATNPDRWMGESGGEAASGYPPEGDYYGSATNPEAQYLWRWIGMHAPDIAIVLIEGERPGWRIPQGFRLAGIESPESPAEGSLAGALTVGSPSAVGPVPALERIGARSGRDALGPVLEALERMPIGPSPARKELQSRLRRTPLEVASELAEVYGHELPSVVYIPAVAVIGRLRLGQFLRHSATLRDIESIVQPYLDGKPTLGDQPTGSHLPGHLIFGELARATGDQAYTRLAVKAAGLGFDSGGDLLVSMPLHNEMSDSVFMGCAILAQAGSLTGEARYYRMALRHLRFMEALDLRPDGLYRHSPLDDAAWGRGNGFSILGLTWSLSEMSGNSPGRSEFLAAYRELLDALLAHQDPTGMWRQVIDREESYRELTSTSMIGYSLAIGLRQGWIAGSRYERALERAWYGVKTRIAADGSLVDVCTGTGKQPDLRAYFDRTAILGRDDRGGAMALLFAVEMASRETSN